MIKMRKPTLSDKISRQIELRNYTRGRNHCDMCKVQKPSHSPLGWEHSATFKISIQQTLIGGDIKSNIYQYKLIKCSKWSTNCCIPIDWQLFFYPIWEISGMPKYHYSLEKEDFSINMEVKEKKMCRKLQPHDKFITFTTI